MGSLSGWVFSTFASPGGIFVLAALDSTLFFSLPFGLDASIIFVAARSTTLAWLVPVIATTGSALGATLTFWMGRRIGDAGLERFVSEKRLARVRSKIKDSGAIALGIVCLIPPPFPFTPFVLAAGALEVRPVVFFSTLIITRLFRFGVEALLAARYGKQILSWMKSPMFQDAITVLVIAAVGLSAWSIFNLVRSSGPRSQTAPAA